MNTTYINLKNLLWKAAFLFIISLSFTACGDKASLSEDVALNSIEAYLKSNPIYETVEINIGEVKFSLKKDKNDLKAYKELEEKGYVNLNLVKQKKKFLSKDSVFTYEVKLTEKARPFVLKQKKETVEVKSLEYQLGDKEQARIELTGKKTAKAVLTLKKVVNDFSILGYDKNPHTDFIVKTFNLNYKKDKGWIVTKSK
ncbi:MULTISPECIES: hypothetical protein [Apibacter]|uniref:hypothetical protein n=1 Tax=Apibacter TaxID=1778601 RepID=UPI001C6A6435|nr:MULTISPECIES: hypothetical protein [Apibacter]QYN51115.1 hypothetical protein GYM72_06025 [Apibacter sp. ESL0404]